jgi:outer membrane receptor protein involved in Fe transport
MRTNKLLTRALLAQAVALALLATGTAHAQAQTQAAPMAADVRAKQLDLSLPAQPLVAALETLAQRTGLQVVYAADVNVRDLRAPAVSGKMSPDEALWRVLEGSGLMFAFVNDSTVTILPAGASKPAAASATTSATPSATAPADGRAPAHTLETMVVTGTNLRGIDPASPLLVIDAEQIESRGFTSVADVLRNLSQNLSSKSSTSAAMGETEFGDLYSPASTLGASAVNLRGLGSRSTLILVDGKRRAGSAQSQGGYTDISSIPLAQVERIEVLSDGASAIYGSDAVAGVVNIVLKKTFEGGMLQARREWSGSDADAARIDASHAFGWTTGSISITAGLERSKPANLLRFIHRGPGGVGDFTDLNGVNTRTRGFGQPGVVYDTFDIGGYHLLLDPIGMIPAGQDGSNFDPSKLKPYDPATAPSYYEMGRLGPDVNNASLRVAGEQMLGAEGATTLSWGVGYTRQKNVENWRPTIFDFNFLEDGFATFVPEANKYNHFGQDVMVTYSYQREFEKLRLSEEQKQENLDLNLGLAGKFPLWKGWDYQLSYTGGRETGQTDSLGDLTGSFGADGYARTQAVLNGLNVFGDGSNPAIVDANAALLQTLVERSRYTFASRAHTLDLLLRGDMFALPAGKVQAALGAQYRTEDYNFNSSLSQTRSESDRGVRAIFGEFGIPLLKDARWAKELTLTLAARHERFNQSGNGSLQDGTFGALGSLATLGNFDLAKITGLPPAATPDGYGAPQRVSRSYSNTSPLARLSWRPFDGLRLRTTWGKSFLTPQAQQQFGILYLEDRTFRLQYAGVNLPTGVDHVIALRGPNNNLKPQVATVKTAGFDFTPKSLPGLSLSMTYNDTNFENYIGDPLSGMTLAQVFANLNQFPQGTFTTGANGVMLWDAREINFLGRRSRSLDTSASYFHNTALGNFRVELNATRTLELSARSLASLPTVTFSDSELGPSKWAADFAANWEKGGYFATVASHYTSGHRVLFPLSGKGTIYNDFTPNPNPQTRAGAYITWDTQLGYRSLSRSAWARGLTTRIGVQNMFNREFPFVDNMYGFLSNRVNVRGRVIYLDIKKEF